MFTRRNLTIAVIGVTALVLAIVVAVIVPALVQNSARVPSDGAIYLYGGDDKLVADGKTLAWNDDLNASMSKTDMNSPIVCPAGTTGSDVFLAKPGQERDPQAWAVWENLGYSDKASTTILLAPLTPDRMAKGAGKSVRVTGGTFSLGVACTSNNGLQVTAAYYRNVTIQPGGTFMVDPLP